MVESPTAPGALRRLVSISGVGAPPSRNCVPAVKRRKAVDRVQHDRVVWAWVLRCTCTTLLFRSHDAFLIWFPRLRSGPRPRPPSKAALSFLFQESVVYFFSHLRVRRVSQWFRDFFCSTQQVAHGRGGGAEGGGNPGTGYCEEDDRACVTWDTVQGGATEDGKGWSARRRAPGQERGRPESHREHQPQPRREGEAGRSGKEGVGAGVRADGVPDGRRRGGLARRSTSATVQVRLCGTAYPNGGRRSPSVCIIGNRNTSEP